MRRPRRLAVADTHRIQLRQLLVGLIAVPISVLPFAGYTSLTPEGRLVRARVTTALSPPSLPRLSAAQRRSIVAQAPRYRDGVVALAYHGIGSGSDGSSRFVISAKRFAQHLAALRAAGMQAVTAADIARSFVSGTPLPHNAVMISFDDGRTDAMLFADGLLAKARMRATMFVITDAAARTGVYYASWDRLVAYARSGRWDIESHTAALHRPQRVADGRLLPALTSRGAGESLDAYQARVRADLAHASATIARRVGTEPVAFAYPFGAYGAERTNDSAIEGILRDEVGRRYSVAFEQDDQQTVPALTATDDHLRLRRIEVGNWSASQLLRRIGRAADSAGLSDRQPPPPAETSPEPATGSLDATPPKEAGTSPLPDVPVSAPRLDIVLPTASLTVPPVTIPRVSVPPVTVPPVTVPPVTTTVVVPPPTIPTIVPPTTTTTRPPPTTTTTRPPPTTTTTRPPSTTTTTTHPPATTTTTLCASNGKKACDSGGSI